MIRNELNSPKLFKLNDDQLNDGLCKIWMEIQMLTGASMYPDDGSQLLDIQLRMLNRFLMSNPKYSRLSLTEILHAFYLNNQGEFADSAPAGSGGVFRHYNKELNAEFIGDVLNAYVRKKSKMYGEKMTDLWRVLDPPVEQKIVLSSEDWQAFIQDDYNDYRAGDTNKIFNTSPKYCYLRRCELIKFSSKKRWWEWYKACLEHRERRARIKAAHAKYTSKRELDLEVEMYRAIHETGMIPKHEHRNVISTMRRLAYLKFFEIISSCAINKIFEEIEFKTTLCNQ